MTQKILDLSITDKRWNKIPRLDARLEQAAQKTLQLLPKKKQLKATATLLLATNARIKQLNHDFRGLNRPTNVLSFPQFEPAELPVKGKQTEPVELGDIAIAYQYVVVEAKKDHKILINHLIHLTIHGLLHLLGYDHISDQEAGAMEGLEKKVMAALDLPDPYLPRQPKELKQAKVTGKKTQNGSLSPSYERFHDNDVSRR